MITATIAFFATVIGAVVLKVIDSRLTKGAEKNAASLVFKDFHSIVELQRLYPTPEKLEQYTTALEIANGLSTDGTMPDWETWGTDEAIARDHQRVLDYLESLKPGEQLTDFRTYDAIKPYVDTIVETTSVWRRDTNDFDLFRCKQRGHPFTRQFIEDQPQYGNLCPQCEQNRLRFAHGPARIERSPNWGQEIQALPMWESPPN